jgi:hypothetical protein
MSSFNTPREVAELIYRLTEIDDSLAESIELELVRMYGGVRKKLQARGITPYRYLDPSNFHTQSG